MRALIYNISVTVGLLFMGAGAWIVFGLGAALLMVGWLVWFTALITTHFETRGLPKGDS